MAILKVKDIRSMSVEQIDEKITELDADMAKMRSQKRSGGAPENTGKMRTIRKTIARLETIKNEKARGAVIEKLKETKAEEKKEKVQSAGKPAAPAAKSDKKSMKAPEKHAKAATKKRKTKD